MRYEYAYKTSDGKRHVEEMEAPSREAVFAALREKGIKAIKVVATDGSKANGEVRVMGVKKRVVFALVAIAVAATASLVLFLDDGAESVAQPQSAEEQPVMKVATPLPRQMIQGDRKRIENLPTNMFANVAETYLSKFAEPGRDFGGIVASGLAESDEELMKILAEPIYVASDEFTEHIDLKRITAGIKREMRAYMAAGYPAADYLAELVTRQNMEIEQRKKAEKKLKDLVDEAKKDGDKQEAYDFWLKANAQLQSMGIYPLPLPEALRTFQPEFDFD